MKFIKKLITRIVVAFFASTILAVLVFRFVPVPFTPLMLIRLAEQAKEGQQLTLEHRWVALEQMSPHLPYAVMASEDQKFRQHNGFDFDAIQYAMKRNHEHPEKQKLGASTITQQTAKNVFLWPGRSWLRKGLEAYFTVLIELCWSKDRIMEVYLNSIETGPGLYGAEAVAQRHFGVSSKELSRSQCALIAATLPNPRRFSSLRPSSYMRKRQSRIERDMRWLERHQ